MVKLDLMKQKKNVDYILTTILFLKMKNESKMMMNSKRCIGDILVDVLENHTEEFDYGNDRDNHSEESGSQ